MNRFITLFLIILLLQEILTFPSDVKVEEDKEDTGKRIAGGQTAAPGQFPYIVMLTYKAMISGIKQRTKFCAGSIINEKWILTAGHCINVFNSELHPKEYKSIAAGTTNLWEDYTQYRQDPLVGATFVHPEYARLRGKAPHDLGLICLQQPLRWNKYIQPIELHRPGEPLEKEGIAAGWGGMTPDESVQAIDLQFTKLPLTPLEECKKIFIYWKEIPSYVTDHHICLTSVNGTSPCSGDFGGPLVQTINGKLKQVGVVSFGYGPGECGKNPTVYAKVADDIEWIEETMKTQTC